MAALTKSRSGTVFHYSLYHTGRSGWKPYCGQCTVGNSALVSEHEFIEGQTLTVCQNCLEYEIPSTILSDSGVKVVDKNTLEIISPEKFRNSALVSQDGYHPD